MYFLITCFMQLLNYCWLWYRKSDFVEITTLGVQNLLLFDNNYNYRLSFQMFLNFIQRTHDSSGSVSDSPFESTACYTFNHLLNFRRPCDCYHLEDVVQSEFSRSIHHRTRIYLFSHDMNAIVAFVSFVGNCLYSRICQAISCAVH